VMLTRRKRGGVWVRHECAPPHARIVTLKAFANFSPGLRYGNPGITGCDFMKDATLFETRVAKAQPWAEISQRFQRYFGCAI
jgi:hypothetical protein